jgi:hypothetical protein
LIGSPFPYFLPIKKIYFTFYKSQNVAYSKLLRAELSTLFNSFINIIFYEVFSSSAIFLGTSPYLVNSMVKVALP